MKKVIEDLASKVTDGAVCVLRAGDEKETRRGFYAPGTISLIKIPGKMSRVACAGCVQESGENYLVDSGGFGEGRKLTSLLIDNAHLFPFNINTVVITHNHPDHVGGVESFPKAEIIMPDSIFCQEQPNYFQLMPTGAYKKPGTEMIVHGRLANPSVKLISTPGHSGWDLSVLCTGKNGVVAIVGDLFWSRHDWEHDSEYLGLCVNPDMQRRSRDHVRKLKPTVVVPGHGPAFAPRY